MQAPHSLQTCCTGDIEGHFSHSEKPTRFSPTKGFLLTLMDYYRKQRILPKLHHILGVKCPSGKIPPLSFDSDCKHYSDHDSHESNYGC